MQVVQDSVHATVALGRAPTRPGCKVAGPDRQGLRKQPGSRPLGDPSRCYSDCWVSASISRSNAPRPTGEAIWRSLAITSSSPLVAEL